jgi:hypothetical protein
VRATFLRISEAEYNMPESDDRKLYVQFFLRFRLDKVGRWVGQRLDVCVCLWVRWLVGLMADVGTAQIYEPARVSQPTRLRPCLF